MPNGNESPRLKWKKKDSFSGRSLSLAHPQLARRRGSKHAMCETLEIFKNGQLKFTSLFMRYNKEHYVCWLQHNSPIFSSIVSFLWSILYLLLFLEARQVWGQILAYLYIFKPHTVYCITECSSLHSNTWDDRDLGERSSITFAGSNATRATSPHLRESFYPLPCLMTFFADISIIETMQEIALKSALFTTMISYLFVTSLSTF